MAQIEADSLCYRYTEEGQDAVHDVTFSVEKGEFVAVLGANGSGKSTLAKLMNALFIPSAGRLTVCGIDTSNEENAWDVRRQCGMVFQNPDNQIVATIVEEDVAFGLENMGVPTAEIRQRVDEALRAVGMTDYAKSAPHMLSGGQKQRVAIAGVLAMRPNIIVFDESTAMLDPVGRREVLDVVLRLNREENITVLWITHFMEEAARANRVMVMDAGSVVAAGTPRDVFRQEKLIRRCGLDVPEMTSLCHLLRQEGLDMRDDILTVDEMVVELCRLKSET